MNYYLHYCCYHCCYQAYLPQNFTLNLGEVESLLKTTSVFESSKSINGTTKLKIILPKYVYQDSLGTESSTAMENYVKDFDSMEEFTLDYTHYKGSKLGMKWAFSDIQTKSLIINGLDTDVMFSGINPAVNKNANIVLKDFTIRNVASKYDVDFRYIKLSKESILKFIDKGLKSLDCASLLTPYSFKTESGKQVLYVENPKPSEKVKFIFSISSKVSEYFNDNTTNTTGTGNFAFLFRTQDNVSYNEGFAIDASIEGKEVSKSFTFERGRDPVFISTGLRLQVNKVNVTNEQLNAWVSSGDIS